VRFCRWWTFWAHYGDRNYCMFYFTCDRSWSLTLLTVGWWCREALYIYRSTRLKTAGLHLLFTELIRRSRSSVTRYDITLRWHYVKVYSSPWLVSLHWLRVPQRIEYKIAVLTYKALHGSVPRYLGPVVPVADLYQAVGHCVLPALVDASCPIRLSTVGSRAFPVASSRIWNALPQETMSAQSLSLFRQHVKSHLFRRYYPDLDFWCSYCPTAYVNSLTFK